jgi:hypothetical protein
VHARACEEAVLASAIQPRDEDDRAGACVSAREGRAGWLAGPAKGRGPVVVSSRGPMLGERGVGRPG